MKPVVQPVLHTCPGCGLGMPRGRGPHGLVWHECLSVSPALLELMRGVGSGVVDIEDGFEERAASVARLELLHRLRSTPGIDAAREAVAVLTPRRAAAAPRRAERAEGGGGGSKGEPGASKALLDMLKAGRPT